MNNIPKHKSLSPLVQDCIQVTGINLCNVTSVADLSDAYHIL